ncbi:PGLP2 [Symbiodinium natans]|uniref:PGLP2 protein n=1 Tax=Symbiodinium natans TaxID=878477 RepID=A0A812TMA9_9DINO|nr:PGLP2 [Symbiodinium natans]
MTLRHPRRVLVTAFAVCFLLQRWHAGSQPRHTPSLALSAPWSHSRELDKHAAQKLLSSADVFVFDLDGVIWIGDKLVDGVQQALVDLRSAGKAVVFATNNAMRTRADVAGRLRLLGVDWAEEKHVFNSAAAVAQLLEARGIPKDRDIYVVGEAGLRDEVQARGYRTRGGPEDAGKTKEDIAEAIDELGEGNSSGAVVCGLDQHLNYYKIAIAAHLVRHGLPLFASNSDLFGQLGSGSQQWPGAGSVIAAVATAAGRKDGTADAVAGKPSVEFAKIIRASLGSPPARRMVMVGDRLDTDIAFGNSAGMQTLLVLSGVTSRAEVSHASGKLRPDFFAESELLQLHDYPLPARQMLIESLHHSISASDATLHPHQVRLLGIAQDALLEGRQKLEVAKLTIEESLQQLEIDLASQDSATTAALASAEAAKRHAETSEATAKDTEAEVAETEQELERKRQSVKDVVQDTARQQRCRREALLAEASLKRLAEGAWAKEEEWWECFCSLQQHLLDTGAENSLLTAATVSLKKRPEDRSSFDGVAVEGVGHFFRSQLEKVDEQLAQQSRLEMEAEATMLGSEALANATRHRAVQQREAASAASTAKESMQAAANTAQAALEAVKATVAQKQQEQATLFWSCRAALRHLVRE